jgi:cytochrome c oxidase subunit 2
LSPTRPDGPVRSARSRRARHALLATFVLLSTSACSTEDLPRLGWPSGVVDETQRSLWLWQTMWVAAFIIGGLTLVLILWPAVFHRRSRMGEVPVQTRYNVPLEVLYTFVPVVIILVIFGYTARDTNEITKLSDNPDNVVNVVGFRWNWTFNYVNDEAYDIGTPEQEATLWLPVGETTRFELTSPDVIHSFWVPEFLFKQDMIPGRTNMVELTPNRVGDYRGRCAELCGVDHSRMLFDVKVVERAEYDAHIAQLQANGQGGLLTTDRVTAEADGRQGRSEINEDLTETRERLAEADRSTDEAAESRSEQ